MQKRPVWMVMLLCGFTIGLGSCQNFPNPLGPPAPPLPPPSPLPSMSMNDDYDPHLDMLEADNDRLKKELASAIRDNARLKKELADTIQDNSLLKDLAAKKER